MAECYANTDLDGGFSKEEINRAIKTSLESAVRKREVTENVCKDIATQKCIYDNTEQRHYAMAENKYRSTHDAEHISENRRFSLEEFEANTQHANWLSVQTAAEDERRRNDPTVQQVNGYVSERSDITFVDDIVESSTSCVAGVFTLEARTGNGQKDHFIDSINEILRKHLSSNDCIVSINESMVTSWKHRETVDLLHRRITDVYSGTSKLVIRIRRRTGENTKLIKCTFELSLTSDLDEDGITEHIEKAFTFLLDECQEVEYTNYSKQKINLNTHIDDYMKYDGEKLTMERIDKADNPDFVLTKHEFYVGGQHAYLCAFETKSSNEYLCCKDSCCLKIKKMGPIKTVNGMILEPDERFFYYNTNDGCAYLRSYTFKNYYMTYNKVDYLKLKRAHQPWSVEFVRKHKACEFQFDIIPV